MKPSLEKIYKFFRLEAERGYDNHAVVGGLDRMLDRWEAEARIDGVDNDLVSLITSRIRDYPRLSVPSRSEVLQGIWRRVLRSEGIAINEEMIASTLPLSQEETLEQVEEITQTERPSQHNGVQTVDNQAQKTRASHTEPTFESKADTFIPTTMDNRPDKPKPTEEPEALNAPVTVLPGIGPKNSETLARLGLFTLRDMLYYFPRRYDDYSQLKPINRLVFGEEVTVIGTIQSVNTRNIRGGRFQMVEAVTSDGTGNLRLIWFNQPWVGKRLRNGTHIVISGKVEQYLGRLVMNNPEWEPVEQQQISTNRIVPVYRLTSNITQRWLRKMLNSVVEFWSPRVPEMLPFDIRQSARLVPISQAISQAHFPDSWEDLKAARYRLAFDEIFLLQLGVLNQKRSWQDQIGEVFLVEDDWLNDQIRQLPFSLTGAQERVVADIRHDLGSGRPMNRLLQGDVGSGKTVIAALAINIITHSGAQAALMAPTSILAEQHFRSLSGFLSQELTPQAEPEVNPETLDYPPDNDRTSLKQDEIRLMIGATPESEKTEIRSGLEDGRIKLVIGTHALIEDPVSFDNLQLVIIDEQHRFGVEQRARLRSKGTNPHLLVMTATPIPRSLALTIYGDLDLSIMDELPPGRQEVSTHVLTPLERERAYSLIKKQVAAGRQAFIIYPLVEESEKSDSKAAVEEHQRLQHEVFSDLKLGLLHGRMRPEEKDDVMTRFRDGELHILVSTSVVEVGVDIPNATVMIIEGANRFGLAQLHQFRGRIGRGADQSYCILIPDSSDGVENERLQVMVETNDGFVLAERDLDQRGPGQFLGTRQSGFAELQMANLTDVHIIENARHHAAKLFETNPELSGTEFAALKTALERFWGETKRGDIS